MSKIMLVNVTHVEESRVAIVDDGVLSGYEVETINRAQLKGNIYNAVVENVHPSLEAAFVWLTPEQKGFLPLDEVNFNLLPARGEARRGGKIGQHLHDGQKIMAQVVREPFAGKPPTISTYFSLPGRFLVLMPGVDSSGVSRKIEDAEQREQLRRIVQELEAPEGFGVIVRTAGLGQTKQELQRDLKYLLRLWQAIQRASRESEFPGLVYREADLVIRTIRDHLTPDIGEVWIDSEETYERALAFVRDVMPARAKTLRLYSGDRLLFSKYNLEEQIEKIYQRRVGLPSGGEIVIDGTEALTAIDVNSARTKRQGDAEEAILQTNIEAAAEIARQVRLRDLGGLIVVDFIDMAHARNNKKVEEAMRAALRGDKAKCDVTRISKLGLLELSRQRLRSAKAASMYVACPTCEGYGLIKTLEAAALAALRKLQTRAIRGDFGRVRVGLPVEVATWMLNHKRDDLVQIERRHNLRIDIEPSTQLLRHEVEIETLPRERGSEPPARVVGDRAVALPPSPQELQRAAEPPVAPGPIAAVAAEPQPGAAESGGRRRRRRRRGRGTGAAAPGTPAPSSGVAAEEPLADAPDAETDDDVEVAVHGAPDDAPDGALDGGSAGPPDAALDSGGRPRRRRRRRRGRRGTGEAAPPAAESGPAPEAETDHEPVVPRGVRGDELMPAAVGRSRRQDGGRRHQGRR